MFLDYTVTHVGRSDITYNILNVCISRRIVLSANIVTCSDLPKNKYHSDLYIFYANTRLRLLITK